MQTTVKSPTRSGALRARRRSRRGRTWPDAATGPDFVEALARGLDVLPCFDAERPPLTLSEVAAATGLARPTARRLLLTLEELGYVRADGRPVRADPAGAVARAWPTSARWACGTSRRPHLERLVAQTGESSSMSQLDGSDIVYVARVAVPKIIALRVEIGTSFPAAQTSQGKVLLAALDAGRAGHELAEPSRSGLPPFLHRATRRASRRELPTSGRAAGRSPTRSWRRVSARSPCRCATATAWCARP